MRGKNFKRRGFFWHKKKQRGLVFGIKRRNSSQDDGCPAATFSTVACVQRWSGIHDMSVSEEKELKGYGKVKCPISLEASQF